MISPPLADVVDTILALNSYFLVVVLCISGARMAYGGYLWIAAGDVDEEQADRGKRFIWTGLGMSLVFVLANWLSSALFRSVAQIPPQPSPKPQPLSLPTAPAITWGVVAGVLIILTIAAVTITYRIRKLGKETDTSSPASTPEKPATRALPEPGLRLELLTREMRGHLLDEEMGESIRRAGRLVQDGLWDADELGRWNDALNQAKADIDGDALFTKAQKVLNTYALGEMSDDMLQQRLRQVRRNGKTALLQRARAIYRSKPALQGAKERSEKDEI